MYEHAYTLLPKLVHLTLVGQDEEHNLEFYGTFKQWHDSARMEEALLNKKHYETTNQ